MFYRVEEIWAWSRTWNGLLQRYSPTFTSNLASKTDFFGVNFARSGMGDSVGVQRVSKKAVSMVLYCSFVESRTK